MSAATDARAGTSCICLLPVLATDQDESVVAAHGLIVLAEMPLRIYLLDARQPLDVPGLPELRPVSNVPMGDHSLWPGTIHVIAVVENRGADPVESVDMRLFGDRQVGDATREAQLYRQRPLERSLIYSIRDNRPPHPSSLSRWEGAVQVDTRFIAPLDSNETPAVHFEQRAHELSEDLSPGNASRTSAMIKRFVHAITRPSFLHSSCHCEPRGALQSPS